MSDFATKASELNKQTSVQKAYVPEADSFSTIATLDGSRLRIPSNQIPKSSPWENANLYRYNFVGSISGAVSNGGMIQCFLTRGSGSGPMSTVPVLRLQVYNPSASVPCYFLPAPLWLQQIQYQTPSGSPISTQDGQGLWNNICENMDSDEFYNQCKTLMSDPAFGSGDAILPLQTQNIYIPLYGNPLSPGKFAVPGLEGDLPVNFTFFPSSVFQIAGGACTLISATIDTPQVQLSSAGLQGLIRKYKNEKHSWFYPYERTMTVTQTWTAGATYQVPLTGIAGDVTFMRFGLYPSLTGLDLAHPAPIASFQFQNNGGEPISGMQYVESEYNRRVMQSKYFKGRMSRRINKYAYVWSRNVEGAQQLITDGVKYGAYPFTNKESMWLVMPPAGTNEVITLTPSSAPASGTFSLIWTNPDMGTYITAPIAYNATAASIQSALNLLPNFTGSCTVTGTMATAVVITMTGGGYQNRSLNADGFIIGVINDMLGTTYTMGVSNIVTTPGVAGITNGGTYTLKIWAYTSSIGHQLPDGSVESQNSG